MKIKIKITRKILDDSRRAFGPRGVSCAVSRAVREIFPHASTGSVLIFPFYMDIKEYYIVTQRPIYNVANKIHLPNEAIQFIAEFDTKSKKDQALMNPISFEIDVPNELIAQIGISEVYSILSTSPTLELVEI